MRENVRENDGRAKKRIRTVKLSRVFDGVRYETPIEEAFFEGSGWGSRGSDLKAAELQIAAQLADVEPNGEAFSWMHRVLGLSSKRMAEILRRRPETISRWENGDGTIDQAAWLVLSKMVKEEAGVDESMRELAEAMV